jgi:putative spermidine/putrescine transport system ATP-binding protein
MTALALSGIAKSFGTFEALKALDLRVNSGELVALLGPSGCGKTTTLRLISGLDVPTSGAVLFDGKDVSDIDVQKRNVGMVFQRYALFPHMSVEQNVSFGLRIRRLDREEIERRVTDMLNIVQLSELRRRYPSQLSGGQMQRVAIARTLITNPAVLMMDEPLANLDTKLRGEMRAFIRSLQRRLAITTVFVTHDQVEAMELADRVAVMFDGKIAQFDAPSNVYHKPSSVAVARFIGAPNILAGKARVGSGRVVLATALGELAVESSGGHSDGEPVEAMIRPEALLLQPVEDASRTGPNALRGRIAAVDFFGQAITYTVAVGSETLHADEMSNRLLPVGAEVLMQPAPARIWIFPKG